ncbi:MAG: ankyrin repeat domain-containing protein [Gammaproteobacteria bacterium]|nr:ankyrin repeat domain-containing protein [Gammaproteobacteria bacterium]MCY4313570.1 ankyrin repeat domain-containing protein [Gammaproteobacteria bacterium]
MNSSEIETRDREGMTSLHIAAASYSVDAVTALLANGAFLEAENSYDPAPLHRASKPGNAEAVQALLAASADPEVPNDLGHAPLVVSRGKDKSKIMEILSEASGYATRNSESTCPICPGWCVFPEDCRNLETLIPVILIY